MAAFINTIGLGRVILAHIVGLFDDPYNHTILLLIFVAFVEAIVLGVFLLVFIFKKPPKFTIYLYIYNLILVMIILGLDGFLS